MIRCLAFITALFLAAPALAQPAPSGQQVLGAAQYKATVNGSITITSGSTFQTALTSVIGTSTARQSLTIQNNNGNKTCSAAGNCDYCYVFIGSGTATAGKSIQLSANQAYTRFFPYVPPDQIQVTCDTTSDTLYIDTQ